MKLAALTVLLSVSVACSGSSAGVGAGASGSSGGTGGGEANAGTAAPDGEFAGAGAACGDVFAYRPSADGTQYITIAIDQTKLPSIEGTSRTFDLAKDIDGVKVGVDVFARAPSSAPYCTDVDAAGTPARWDAESGTVTIGLTGSNVPGLKRATLELRDLHLVGPERGAAAVVPHVTLENVTVAPPSG